MSVIVAKSSCCGYTAPQSETNCIPASMITGLVPVGETHAFGDALIAEIASIKWHVVLMNSGGTHIRAFEVYAAHERGNPMNVQYSFVGYKFSTTITAIISGGKLQLQINNSDGEDIEVYITQLVVPYSLTYLSTTDYVDVTTNRTLISANDTQCVDLFGDFCVGMKWAISVETSTGSHTTFQAMSIGGSVNQYAVAGGDSSPYVLSAEITPFGNRLLLTNSSSDAVRVVVTRIPIQYTDSNERGCGHASSAPLWCHPSRLFQPGVDNIADTIANPSGKMAKWLIALTNTTTFDVYCFEISAAIPNNNFSQYAMIGTYQDTIIEMINNPSELHLTNNTASPLQINILHLPVGL